MALHLIDQADRLDRLPDTALWAVIIVDVWKTTPFMALLILAGLQMLPRECYEAARVDGVHPVRVFWKVTLPLLRPALLVAVIFRVLDALRIFDLIYVHDRQQQGHDVDVGLCAPAAGRLPGRGLSARPQPPCCS